MKRKIALILVLALALALCACGGRSQQSDQAQEQNAQNAALDGANVGETATPTPVVVTPTVVVTAFPVPSSTPAPTPTIAPTPTVAPTPAPDGYAAPTATATDKEKENGHYAYVQGSGINVRAEASSGDTPIIDVVNLGDRVLVLGEENGWSKVIFNNKVGYIYSPFLGVNYPVQNQIVPNTPANEGNATIIDPNGNASLIGGDDSGSGTGVIVLG